MSRNGRNGKSPRLDLKLNISPPRANPLRMNSLLPTRSMSVSPMSMSPSSCISLEAECEKGRLPSYPSSPEATSMVLVGCPHCLMYVMLSEEEPRCPKCKGTVLLDFLGNNSLDNNSNSSGNNNNVVNDSNTHNDYWNNTSKRIW